MFHLLTSAAQLFQSPEFDLHGAPLAPFSTHTPDLHGGVRPPIPDID